MKKLIAIHRSYMGEMAMLRRVEQDVIARRGREMGTVIKVARGASDDPLADSDRSQSFDFLPQSLRSQCRSLIESYHALHGFGCLPNILWRAGLGPFIENHREFRQLLKKASTNRSAKKSSEGFTQIAATLLSLEILASNLAGWSALYPQATSLAKSILKRYAHSCGTRLMESYQIGRASCRERV